MLRRRMSAMVGLIAGVVSVAAGATAVDFSGFPKLAPLYPPPPWLATNTEHVVILFEGDEPTIRELLPPTIEPAPGATLGLDMYRAQYAVGLGPYTKTYIWADVKGFDSADGTKGRVMLHGWCAPDPVTAAFREVAAFPVKLGITRLEQTGNALRAVLTRDGTDMLEARITIRDDSRVRFSTVLNYPVFRLVPSVHGTQAALAELIVHRIPYAGELYAATLQSLEFKVSANDPVRRLTPKRLLKALYIKGGSLSLGYADVIFGSNKP